MLALGIERSLKESRHADVGLDHTDDGTRILHILTVFLRQRVGNLLLPFHLVLLDDGIHQQGDLSLVDGDGQVDVADHVKLSKIILNQQ